MNTNILVLGLVALFIGAAAAEPAATGGATEPMTNPFLDVDMLPGAAGFGHWEKAGPTEAEVGDPDSFGRAQTYLGVMQTQNVSLRASCAGIPGNCVELNPAPASTNVDFSDLAVFELPKKATNSILCFTITPFANWTYGNATGTSQTAEMALRPRVRIESDVLNDPTLIDPATGMPFGGVLFDSPVSTGIEFKTIDPGYFELRFSSVTRSCTGGFVNRRVLANAYGLPPAVIDDFFKQPITVSFGVMGSVRMVDSAGYSVGVRLYGD